MQQQDMLGPDQGYDGMYGQGPPSVHSSHGGRPYGNQGYDTLPINSLECLDIDSHGPMDAMDAMDAMDVENDSTTLDFDQLGDLPQPPHAWYDTDL